MLCNRPVENIRNEQGKVRLQATLAIDDHTRPGEGHALSGTPPPPGAVAWGFGSG